MSYERYRVDARQRAKDPRDGTSKCKTYPVQQMVKNSILSSFIGFATRLNMVFHKKNHCETGAETSQHGGQHITHFRPEGCNELSQIDRN